MGAFVWVLSFRAWVRASCVKYVLLQAMNIGVGVRQRRIDRGEEFLDSCHSTLVLVQR
jgi:hypothetical protein